MANSANSTTNIKDTTYGKIMDGVLLDGDYKEYKKLYSDTLEQAHSVENAKKVISKFIVKHVIPARGQSIQDNSSAVAETGFFTLPTTAVSFVVSAETKKGKFTCSGAEAPIFHKSFIALSYEEFQTTMSGICTDLHLNCSNFVSQEGKDGAHTYSFDVTFDFEE